MSQTQDAGEASVSSAALPLGRLEEMVDVTAVARCIVDNVRRAPGERFRVRKDRADALAAVGHVMPDAFFELMHPTGAALWRKMASSRRSLTPDTLVVDDQQAAALWASAGRILSPEGLTSSVQPATPAPDAIRVLQLTHYDPGSAVYRYHTAANTDPSVVSAFARWGYSNPHCHLRQWDGDLHRQTVEFLAMTADVIHVHMDYRTLHQDLKYSLWPDQRVAITYHGSMLPNDPRKTYVDEDADRRNRAIQFGARPYHGRHGIERYLPIPMPVDDYLTLVAKPAGGPFRIAHSPTKRAIKGTSVLLEAVEDCKVLDNVSCEVVLIEGMDHGDALRRKATCHATFDSFWLGMQGSGLEGAAMGQPVIAGDPLAAEEAARLNDDLIPWTYANDKATLRYVIRRLAEDAMFYRAEAVRVHEYVRRLHDYRAVGAQYATFLREALGRGPANPL
jgi:hypothetical protein